MAGQFALSRGPIKKKRAPRSIQDAPTFVPLLPVDHRLCGYCYGASMTIFLPAFCQPVTGMVYFYYSYSSCSYIPHHLVDGGDSIKWWAEFPFNPLVMQCRRPAHPGLDPNADPDHAGSGRRHWRGDAWKATTPIGNYWQRKLCRESQRQFLQLSELFGSVARQAETSL